MGFGSTLSVADTVNVTMLPLALVASTTRFDEQFTTGAIVSMMVTVNVQVLVFRAVS